MSKNLKAVSTSTMPPTVVGLTLNERFALLAILPTEGNRINGRVLSDLIHELSPSEDDHKRFKITAAPEGGIQWQNDAEIDIHIGEIARSIIVAKLKELDKAEKLDIKRHLTLCDKFLD